MHLGDGNPHHDTGPAGLLGVPGGDRKCWGAAGAQPSNPKSKVVMRTQSLDRCAAARLVAAAVAARAEGAADRQARQGPMKRGKNLFHKSRAELLILYPY